MVEKGLACNCYCPNCNSKLIARKGDVRNPHFSHYKNNDCGWNGESVIHKISKEIISKSKILQLPRLIWDYKTNIVIYEKTEIPIYNVRLEERIGNIIPDIIIETQGREVLVEIKVTHGVDYDKTQKIKNLNLPTIEIDISRIIRTSFFDRDYFLKSYKFAEALTDDSTNRYWIYNPEKKRIKNLLKQYCQKKVIDRLFSTIEDLSDFDYIENCPLNKRLWKSGYKEGVSYARLEEDCYQCYCYLGQDKHFSEDSITGEIKLELPMIYCLGEKAKNNNSEIKSIILENKRDIRNYLKSE